MNEKKAIDEIDANAKQHDLDYDKDNLKGLKGVLDSISTEANEDYIERASKTIDKYKNGEEAIKNVTIIKYGNLGNSHIIK